MTERILSLRARVIAERGAGARARYLPGIAMQSLRRTASEPLEIRRAKAQAHILDTAQLSLLPGELLTSSPMGCCPIDPAAPDPIQSRRVFGDETDADRAATPLPWTPASCFAPDFQTLLNVGFRGLDAIARQGQKSASTPEGAQFFEAQRIALGAAQRFMLRCANAVAGEANRTGDLRGAELSGMAQTLRKLALERADTFYEGMQLILSTVTMLSLCGSESVALGRLDRLLGARYDEDIQSGGITEPDARELVQCLLVKLNEPGHLGACAITLGGATEADADGANALTALCLEAARELALPHPNLAVRLGGTSPDWLVKAASDLASSGVGQPLILSDEVYIERLIRRGVPYQSAHDYCLIGDGFIGLPGQSGLTFAGAIALPELTARVHARGLAGELVLSTFDQFLEGYKAELSRAAADIWLASHERAREMERSHRDPLASMLIRGCASSGLDALRGGAALGRTFVVPLLGLATAADALCAVKKRVYEQGIVRLDTLAQAALDGFDQRGQLLRLLRASPRYGNDLDEVDRIAQAVLAAASEAVAQLSLAGGADRFAPALADGGLHASLGGRMAATWDGRQRGEPVSGGADPHPGRDAGGLSALIRSAAKLDSERLTGGFALNIALRPASLAASGAAEELIRRCLEAGLPALRLCAQDSDALLDNRDSRERALIGCVSGVCDWFCELDAALRDEIIKRTVHTLDITP